LWITQALSAIGTMVTGVAVTVQVYDLTHSSLAVGLIGVTKALPLILVSLFAASLVDMGDRRRLAMVSSSLLALVSVLFALQAMFDLRLVWLLYVLTTVQSALFAVDVSATRAFMPRLVRAELIPSAAALSQLAFQISLVSGSLLGGAIIAVAGTMAAYVVDAVGFLIAVYGIIRLPSLPVDNGGVNPGLRAAFEGLRFVLGHRILLTVFTVDLIATVIAMPMAMFPAIAEVNLGGGSDMVGLLFAAPAIGGVLGALFSGGLSRVRRQGLAVLCAATVWGVSIAGFGLAAMLWLAVLLLAVAGAADMVSGVFRMTLLQVNTPDELRGRVNALGLVIDQAGPSLGGVRAGVVATVATPVVSVVSGGLACAVGVLLVGLLVPAFVQYRGAVGPLAEH
jgi:MFS family permease